MNNVNRNRQRIGLLVFAAPLAVGLLLAAPYVPQDAPSATPKETKKEVAKEFEVASIKPSDPSAHGMRFQIAPGGRLTASNVTVKMLVQQAYDVKSFQITGGPGWLGTEHYDIVAKGEGATSPDDFKPMLQALLTQRFHLTFHRESKELPIYALVVGKNGPKLTENTGGPGPQMSMGRGQLTGKKISMTMFATQLSNQLGRTVQDKTDLKGNYDIKLEWTPDQNQPIGPREAKEGGPDAPPPPVVDASGPTIFTALNEQLGLKLESQKGPVSMLILDSAEKASEN
jgi:bla regulator protein blaR1